MSHITCTDHYIHVNNIKLHYIQYRGDGPLLLMMHGLTANAHAFDGLVVAGLFPDYNVVSVDLRGRGLSDHPAFNYTQEDHAKDIIGVMDHLKAEKVLLLGHSFGGYLGFYLATNYPERVEKLIVLDAAAKMNPNIVEMLGFSFARFSNTFPSFNDYIAEVKKAPYNDIWDKEMLSYYHADVKTAPDGSVHTRSNLTDILECSVGLSNIDWPYYISSITQPVLLINALDVYTLGEPLLPEQYAKDTVAMLKNGQYVGVEGNHQTMLYGDGANEIVKAIKHFVRQ